ncbi:hypothetical protein [Micromonospora coxensis]|uniref:hypothetical protein n=1 Tax=Micromonospora coxensis TaxID=356852 RepID=UPI003426F47C
MISSPPVVRARWRDVDLIVELVTATVTPTVVAAWLVPDERRRRDVLTDVARLWVEHALLFGDAFLLAGGTAATVWFHHYRPIPAPVRYERRLADACAGQVDRFLLLDRALATHRPTQPHNHLAFLAVPPGPRRADRAEAVLVGSQRRMDTLGLPTYAETWTGAHRDLHLRHGYQPRGDFPLGNGLLVHPTWRLSPLPAGRRNAGTGHWSSARPARRARNDRLTGPVAR